MLTKARIYAGLGLAALGLLAACSETATAPRPSGLSPHGASFVAIPTPPQILATGGLGAFTNTIDANESLRLTTEFWDNVSSDDNGSGCNAGFFASGTIVGSCLFETPGSTANQGGYDHFWGQGAAGNDPAPFQFVGTNTYTVTLQGDYAGAGSTVGYFTHDATNGYLFTPVANWTNKVIAPNAGATVTVGPFAAGVTWGFFINTIVPQVGGCGGAANPNYACTDATGGFAGATATSSGPNNQQFALFSNSGGTQFLVGAEDNTLLLIGDLPNPLLHDSDYNDYMLSITPIINDFHGCTLGFWKNHTSNWHSPYTTSTTLGSVFTGTGTSSGSTFLQALAFKGGPAIQDAKNLLLKQAVAALLNSVTPGMNYTLTTAAIIAEVNTALASNDRNTILVEATRLEGFNSLEGPLC